LTLLLDTTVLIDVLRARRGRREMLAGLIRAGHSLTTTVMNVAEVYAGMRPAEEQETQAFLDGLECFPITLPVARRAGRMKSALARTGRTISLADIIIAAAAIEYNATLMTDNQRDFAASEVPLYPLK
jgi:predicted nucleic acid-binding protein